MKTCWNWLRWKFVNCCPQVNSTATMLQSFAFQRLKLLQAMRHVLAFVTPAPFVWSTALVTRVAARKALEGEEKWVKSVEDLMEAVDEYSPEPERDRDKPFLMPIEDVFTITGRGTVVTGRAER